jgi:hypothetical protein
MGVQRLCVVDYNDGIWSVQVGVDPGSIDFAELLRTVERWAARAGLFGLRFHVDGRSYVLVAREVDAAVV